MRPLEQQLTDAAIGEPELGGCLDNREHVPNTNGFVALVNGSGGNTSIGARTLGTFKVAGEGRLELAGLTRLLAEPCGTTTTEPSVSQ